MRSQQERERLHAQLDELQGRKLAIAASSSKANDHVAEVNDEIEGCVAKLDYVQEQVADCHRQIVAVGDSKVRRARRDLRRRHDLGSQDESEDESIAALVECESLQEASSLFRHLVDFCISTVRHAACHFRSAIYPPLIREREALSARRRATTTRRSCSRCSTTMPSASSCCDTSSPPASTAAASRCLTVSVLVSCACVSVALRSRGCRLSRPV